MENPGDPKIAQEQPRLQEVQPVERTRPPVTLEIEYTLVFGNLLLPSQKFNRNRAEAAELTFLANLAIISQAFHVGFSASRDTFSIPAVSTTIPECSEPTMRGGKGVAKRLE